MFFRKLLTSNAPASVLLIRLMVGLVFLSEGIQKFLYPDAVGPGRFAKIGLPEPGFLAYFVAVFEIMCGILIALGLLKRLAVIPTITMMLVAIASTKIPILMSEGFWKNGARSSNRLVDATWFHFPADWGAGQSSMDAWLIRSQQGKSDLT